MARRVSDLYSSAFVTGAGSGLGLAFTEMLLAEGVRVWGTSREASRLASLAAGHASRFFPLTLDLNDAPGAVDAFLGAARQAEGAFDLVINNAGYGIFGEFDAVPAAQWKTQVGAMLGSTIVLTHAAYGAMRVRNRGCLVNVSSMAAEFPLPFMTGYNVAKAGLSALSESLLFESRGTGVKVIDFRPGDYRTSFNQAMQTPAAARDASRRTQGAWRVLEANLAASPAPARAAADLRRALLRQRRGAVRSGPFFQIVMAPLLARLCPAWLLRAGTARYFGST
jgi:short-subunit dehydrogenase